MDRTFDVIGYRMPMAVALVAGLTLGATILTAVGMQAGSPMATLFVLAPAKVLEGQVWRLVTWAFVELNLLSLVFALVALALWVGTDLCGRWGWRRFLAVYLGFSAATGGLLCALAYFVPLLRGAMWATTWSTLTALIVGWAIANPHAQIRFMLFLPANGRQIIWITLALIVLGAAFNGPVVMLPDLVAFVLALVYFKDPSLRLLWYRLQSGGRGGRSRPRPSHLRPVESEHRPRWYH